MPSDIRFQKLDGVCNGGHLWHLGGWRNYMEGGSQSGDIHAPLYGHPTSVSDLLLAMGYQTKVLLVVDRHEQKYLVDVLKSIEIPKEVNSDGTLHYIQAKQVDHWSGSADLWIIRRFAAGLSWGDSI